MLKLLDSRSKQIILFAIKYGQTYDLRNIITTISRNLFDFFDTQIASNIIVSIFECHYTEHKEAEFICEFISSFENELN